MSARWCRWYCGTYSDPKFGAIARRTSRTVAESSSVWSAILESAAETGTSRYRFDADAIAAVLGIETTAVEAIHAEMARMQMVADWTITNWDRRQFVSDSSTGRSRRCRERRRGDAATPTQCCSDVAETSAQQQTAVAETETQRCATPPESETEAEKKESPELRSGERVATNGGAGPAKSSRRKPRHSLPADCPTAAERQAAAKFWIEQGRDDLATQVAAQAEQFRDHHTAKGSLQADWSAAWRTWMRNAPEFTKRKTANVGNKPTNVDRAFNGVRAALTTMGTRRNGQLAAETTDAGRDTGEMSGA